MTYVKTKLPDIKDFFKTLPVAVNIPLIAVLFLSGFFFFGANYISVNMPYVTLDTIIFTVIAPMSGVYSGSVELFLLYCLLPTVLTTVAVWLAILAAVKYIKKNLKFRKALAALSFLTCSALLLGSSFSHAASVTGLFEFLSDITTESDFIENHYVDPRTVELTFPETPRNLIYIFMESMETSYMSRESGGHMPHNLIPNLTALAEENTHFSNRQESVFGGAFQATGTTRTIASMVANTSGLPLKLPVGAGEFNAHLLPATVTIGDILAQQGYNQTLMVGSDATFGGRREYFTRHGNYRILDWHTAQEDGVIPEGYSVFWGFEDRRLYEYAKTELTRLSSEQQPFNFTMLTVDTHYPHGYACDLCDETPFSQQRDAVISCADRQIDGFIRWIQTQEFYDNTTIVIVGDHLSMKINYIDAPVSERKIFNVFINSAAETPNPGFLHNRDFSSMDFFPTTLAALGVTIQGERLALGTNLFSGVPTLPEIYTVDVFNDELALLSRFYNAKFRD
jgi:phosphoglycerol transferase